MKVIERKPIPIYEVICTECKSRLQYKASEVSWNHITCPVCGISFWVDEVHPVKMDEVEELNRYIHADKMADELSKVLWCNQEDKKQAVRMVKEFPTADVVEVRHGRWIDDETAYICSVCFHGSPSGAKWNYCPNCGAKMDGEQNE